MPVFKYFCPECGLVLQSDTDVTDHSVKCLGCHTIFIAQPMNRPSAAESKVLRKPAEPPRKPKTAAQPPAPVAAPRPSVVRQPDPPAHVPVYDPPAQPTKPRPAPPPPPPPKTGLKPKRRSEVPPQDDEEEIISLRPVRKKRRWPLVVALLGVCLAMAAGGGTALWYFVLKGDSLKYTAAASDKAWTIRLPDTPQTNETKEGNSEYLYTRPGKDAEFGVNVAESQEANPEEMIDLGAGLMFAAVAQKYKLDSLAATLPKADMSKYDGEYTRRLYEVDTGSRGKLTVQLILVNWSNSKSTTIIQVAIGKDISDSERNAFFKSVEIKKGAR